MKKFRRVYIEITNCCNLSCSFCSHTGRKKDYMTYESFTSIIDQVKNLADTAVFHVLGEPLMHPRLENFIDYTLDSGMDVMITTNGTLLHTQNGQRLVGKRISCINISLHAASEMKQPEAYLENVLNFIESFEFTDTVINLRLWNIFIGENEFIIDKINAHFNSCISVPEGIKSLKKNKIRYLRDNVFIHFDTRFEWPDIGIEEISSTGSCYGLKSHFGILCDGTVIPCCLDAEGIINLGNVNDDEIENIINGSRAEYIKLNFENGILAESLCRRCGYAKRFRRKKRH
ncbi:MAG: SPASM domain-containing protein [Spirochaetes bacterium]|nr:SPASM domain-containing protein [Spirochaetota bacterium]